MQQGVNPVHGSAPYVDGELLYACTEKKGATIYYIGNDIFLSLLHEYRRQQFPPHDMER